MKQRLLVMNGQRLVQSESEGEWVTDKVEKAGAVKPGIYNIYLSSQADKNKIHDGVILHADKDYVYQQVGKGFIKHNAVDFKKQPEVGNNLSIKYNNEGQASTDQLSNSLKRGLSR